MAHKLGLGTGRTYQPGQMPLPTRPRPGSRTRNQARHQEMSSEANSSNSQLRAAVPPKKARVEEEIQTNDTMEEFTEKGNKLKRMRKSQ